MRKKLSPTLENYLRTIRSLETDDGAVRSVDIACALGVSRPSVHMAIVKLEQEALVRHDRYSTVSLTDSGRAAADKILKKRNLARRLVESAAGKNQEAAKAEICAIEHLSEETLASLVNLLGRSTDAPAVK